MSTQMIISIIIFILVIVCIITERVHRTSAAIVGAVLLIIAGVMSFDECIDYPVTYEYAKASTERTLRWAIRGKNVHNNPNQSLFGIVQGGEFEDLRRWSAEETVKQNFDGYSICDSLEVSYVIREGNTFLKYNENNSINDVDYNNCNNKPNLNHLLKIYQIL